MFFIIPLSPVFGLFIDFLVIDLLLEELAKFFPFIFDEFTKDDLYYEMNFLSELSLCNKLSLSNLRIDMLFGFKKDPCSTNKDELLCLLFYFL